MAKLNVLGAQRVKALIAMLNEKEKKEIAKIRSQQMTHDEAEKVVDEEFGVSGIVEEMKSLRVRLAQLSDELNAKTGKYININNNYSYNSPTYSKYSNRRNNLMLGDVNEKIAELRKEFAEKESRLWLCETLEEAKAIVGIE